MSHLWKSFVLAAGSCTFHPSMEDRFCVFFFIGDVFGQAGRRIASEHLRHYGLSRHNACRKQFKST
jgi:hypothetical protein